MNHTRLLVLLLVAYFCKQMVWVSLVPLWHFPDEQSHVGQVAYIAETGKQPTGFVPDLTEEIRRSEELLGTERDQMGVNKFTYHPEYRIVYTDSLIGKYEQEIRDLVHLPSSRTMVKYEASHYPPTYYILLAGIYRLLAAQDLFVRVFSLRVIQVLFSVGTIFVSFRIGKQLFSDWFGGILVGSLVAFQPMFSFVSAGINSDNIGNFVFSVYILCAINTLQKRVRIRDMVFLIGISLLAMTVKPQFLIVLPLSLLLLVYQSYRFMQSRGYSKKGYGVVCAVLMVSVWLVFLFQLPGTLVVQSFLAQFDGASFLHYVRTYLISHLYHEVLPWYWGIYDWLGVTYPRPVHRVINWIGIVSLVGIVAAFWQKRYGRNLRQWGLALLITGALLLGIYGYDWSAWSQTNIHLGVQGRYLFPTISLHMGFLLLGLMGLVPTSHRYRLGTIAVGAMMVLHTYALWLIATTYYDTSSLAIFLLQVSQYKPVFFKGIGVLLLIGISAVTTLVFCWQLWRSSYQSHEMV